jgi:membrane-bound serine protease (ClpP class)
MPFVVQAFMVLLIAGLLLVGAEIFVPGAILGVIGGLCLVGAIVTGFMAFPDAGTYIAILIVLLIGVVIWLWVRIFPRTRLGRSMTVEQDLSTSKAADPSLTQFVGKTGEAASDLRPAGFAILDGQRVDVVSDGHLIRKGAKITVLRVEGVRVVVSQTDSASA